MKKNYIYILIGMLCFLGFNMEAKADYKNICEYELNEDDIIYNVIIGHDSSNNDEPYKITAQKLKKNSSGEYLEDEKTIYSFKNSGNANGKLAGNNAHSYAEISPTQCPNNVGVYFSWMSDKICFYSDTKGENQCKNFENRMKKISGGKINSNNGNYSNLTDGQSCDFTVELKQTNNTASPCLVQFKYNASGDNLKIYYKTESDASATELNSYNTSFSCGKVGSGHTQQGIESVYAAKIFLTNTAAGLPSADVLIKDRNTFDKKYLEEWNSTGQCPYLYTDTSGDGNRTTSTTNFYILFKDAADLCKEQGCANVDSDDFALLRPWDYNWDEWYTTGSDYDSCEGLLGDRIIGIISEILLYVRILIPVALIGFGIADFVKAVFSSKEDEMKKAQVRFLKRLVMAAIVFIIPSLVNLLLNTIDGIWAHVNNSACNIWD